MKKAPRWMGVAAKDSREGGGLEQTVEREEKWNSAIKARKTVAESDKWPCSLLLSKWRADNK